MATVTINRPSRTTVIPRRVASTMRLPAVNVPEQYHSEPELSEEEIFELVNKTVKASRRKKHAEKFRKTMQEMQVLAPTIWENEEEFQKELQSIIKKVRAEL
ncbi:hypothetical protein AGMMS49938_11210 [Fibrobacterales bacterium]|nr:hypothetical protein AGMMS49938_11210 [Fibrobacterales bacterium]